MSDPRPLRWIASRASAPLRGELRVPGDKSISHRAVMLAALADGVSRIEGFLDGEDTRATAAAFIQMGVRIDAPDPTTRIVHGVGVDGLKQPAGDIDCGNAGTGMRLLAGVLAGQRFDSRLIGDASLSRRPMQRVTEPLARMGARIEAVEGRPPLQLFATGGLHGISYELPIASAQVKSALLLAGLFADGETCVREPHPTRDYSERMLRTFGVDIDFEPGLARLRGGQRLRATDVAVPSDFSSAAFFIVAASIVPGSDLLLREVGINPRRTGLLHALSEMGADIQVNGERESGGERVADLRIRHAGLRGAAIDPAWVSDMIDEFPALFVAAACAGGSTRISGAAELRVKESDRIAAMARGLQALGVAVDEHPDGATVHGGNIGAGQVDSLSDHRIAMSFAVAGQVATGSVAIDDCANVATSFPGFVERARSCGFSLAAAD